MKIGRENIDNGMQHSMRDMLPRWGNQSLHYIHRPSISHMLKEVNASANTVCEVPEQVVDTLAYVIRGDLPPTPRDGYEFLPIADRLGKGNPNP
jgi:hypothetical protein